jgi:hypothetical protein
LCHGSQVLLQIESEPNYVGLYAANVSAWANTTAHLTFSAPPLSNGGLNFWMIDDISFSSIAVAPEPNPLLLTEQ